MKEILKQLFLTRQEFSDKYGLKSRSISGIIRGEWLGKNKTKIENSIKLHLSYIQSLLDDRQDKLEKDKESYLNDIDLNNIQVKYIFNTNECKIIELELDIKHPQATISNSINIDFEGYLPTSYKDYDKYKSGLIIQSIKILDGYKIIGMMSDKYILYLTLIKDEMEEKALYLKLKEKYEPDRNLLYV